MKQMILVVVLLLLAACTSPPPPETAVPTATPVAGALNPVDETDDSNSATPTAPAYPTNPQPTDIPVQAEAYPILPATPVPVDPYAAPESEEAEEAEAVDLLDTEASTRDVTIIADDDLQMVGTLSIPAGEAPFPGVILLHMVGSNRQIWQENEFAANLAANGYAVLAMDMRGHGDTGGSRDWVQAVNDMRSIHTYFVNRLEVDADKTAVVGASIGSNMALVTGAEIPSIDTVVLLSPGLDYFGVTTADRLAQYGERPLLIVASSEDSYAAESSQTLANSAFTGSQFELYDGAGHGTTMFNNEPGLSQLILDWLNQNIS